MRNLILPLLVFALAGCSGARVDESADAGQPLAQPDSTTTEAPSTRAEPVKSERGLLPKQFAERVGCDPRDVLITSAQTGLGLTAVDRRGGLSDELVRLMTEEPADAPAPDEPETEPAAEPES